MSPSETPTLVAPFRASGSRAWRRAASLSVVMIALLATAITLAFRRDSRANVAAAMADSLRAESLATPGLIASAVDSARLDSAARDSEAVRDSASAGVKDVGKPPTRPTATPTTGKLTVSAPANARVSFNGQAVADGAWRDDSLKPGDYVVGASIPASSGCSWATVEERVTVRAGAVRNVSLTPRACGTIAIHLLNVASGARYTVVSTDDKVRLEGALPLDGGLVVPAGTYRLTAQQPLCASYVNESVVVAAERPTALTFRVICERND
jgi:hypothetical protein